MLLAVMFFQQTLFSLKYYKFESFLRIYCIFLKLLQNVFGNVNLYVKG